MTITRLFYCFLKCRYFRADKVVDRVSYTPPDAKNE